MKYRALLSLFMLAGAATAAQAAPQPSHIEIITEPADHEYIGDCFAGFFRSDQEMGAGGATNWVFIDPYDDTGEIQIDKHHLILRRISHQGSEAKGHVHNRYRNDDSSVQVDLDYRVTNIDQDGLHFYQATLAVKYSGGEEHLELKGRGGC